jgi:rare lipoprotein A
MRFHLSEGFMPIKQKSSLSGTRSGLGLTSRDHGAIASAIAPLMVLFVNLAAPRPALGQTAKDEKTERIALYAPQRGMIQLAVRDLPPVLRLLERGLRANARTSFDATPELQALLATLWREPARLGPPLMREPIVGIASMYNPCAPGTPSGGAETASGELYDAEGWTAAIQIDLRARFGGVRFGRNYRHAYALIEGEDKRAIVKINDVGPLQPGRVIDLNERAMRYFDPSLALGLVPNVRITPLEGTNWTPGPVEDDSLISALPAPRGHPVGEQLATNMN